MGRSGLEGTWLKVVFLSLSLVSTLLFILQSLLSHISYTIKYLSIDSSKRGVKNDLDDLEVRQSGLDWMALLIPSFPIPSLYSTLSFTLIQSFDYSHNQDLFVTILTLFFFRCISILKCGSSLFVPSLILRMCMTVLGFDMKEGEEKKRWAGYAKWAFQF